jgi:glucokinase
VDNDANCGALGEWQFGAGAAQGLASLLYVTVSTGIGGGWIVHGQVYRGADGMAGEIGHTTVDPLGPLCICGRRGCLEVMACGPAIAEAARAALASGRGGGQILLELAHGDAGAITAKTVSRAASAGDALAREALLAAARHLGTGLGNAASLMNPGLIVLGGGVTQSGAAWWAEVRRAAQANTLSQIAVRVVPARLDQDAPLWGAAFLAADLLA